MSSVLNHGQVVDPNASPGSPGDEMPHWNGTTWVQPHHGTDQYSHQQQFAPASQQQYIPHTHQQQQFAQQPYTQQQYSSSAQQQQPFYDPSAAYQSQPSQPQFSQQYSPTLSGSGSSDFFQQQPQQQPQPINTSFAGGAAAYGAQPQAQAQMQWQPMAGPGPLGAAGLMQLSPTGQFLGGKHDEKPPPPQRACTRCKRLKVRCEPINNERPCKRCRNANAECETAPRKQRPKKADKERAARLAAEEDARRQREEDGFSTEGEDSDADSDDWVDPALHGSPDEAGVKAPFQWIMDGARAKDRAAASISSPPLGAPVSPTTSTTSTSVSTGAKDKDKGKDKNFLRPGYFNPDPAASIPLANVPGADKLEILGVLTPSEIEMLFKQFMSKINPYMSMFDEKLHTVEYVRDKSPFLLSVITMLASRYYTNRADAYVRVVEIVKRLAGEAIVNMTQSIEHCQAFILLSAYPAPDRKYSENKNWLYSGVAFRMATDLGLYKPQALPAVQTAETELQEREALNRTRTWIICFYLDESVSSHFGRPATISRDDPVVKNSLNWWRTNRTRLGHVHDVHLVLFVELLRAFRNAIDKSQVDPTGGADAEEAVDYDRICREFDAEVSQQIKVCEKTYEEATDRTDPVCILRERMGDFTTQYARLIVHSTAFQKGKHHSSEAEDLCLSKCLESAFRVLEILMNDIATTGLLRYAPDGYFWYASFASAFLLRFLGPEHHDKVDDNTRDRIVVRVRELIEVLGSKAIAVDGSHPPKLFSKFLHGMLNKHVRQAAKAASAANAADSPEHAVDQVSMSSPGHETASSVSTSPVAAVHSALQSSTSTLGSVQQIDLPIPPTPPSHVQHVPQQQPQSQTQQWSAQAQPIAPPQGMFGGGFDMGTWAPARDTLMQDVDVVELHTGMFILDHPPWWTDPSLGIDMAALQMGAGAGAGAAGGGSGGAGDAQDPFASFDASKFGSA